jgi:hypothetical protein
MGKLLCILAFLLGCVSLNAQTITGRDYITGTINLPCTVQFNRDSVPKRCWGITEDDRTALRLYPSVVEKQKWYDFSTYKFKGEGKRAVWISYAVAGILHGGREAYHAEPTVLQNIFGGPDDSWIGPMQWKRQYYKGDPELPHKPNLFNPVRDYYHFSGAATKTVWIGGAFTIGMSKQPMKYKLLDLMIGALITSGTASLTYNIIR